MIIDMIIRELQYPIAELVDIFFQSEQLTLGVQFNNCNVPCETLDKWRLKSSLLFTLTNCFNLRAARYKNMPSYYRKKNQKGCGSNKILKNEKLS